MNEQKHNPELSSNKYKYFFKKVHGLYENSVRLLKKLRKFNTGFLRRKEDGGLYEFISCC